MIASIMIILFSLVLLAYWFRYSCVLLLRNLNEATTASTGTPDPRFRFGDVQQQLAQAAELDPLHQALKRDYQLLTYLVEHAAGLRIESLDDRLLMLDYKVMALYYKVTRTAAPAQARRALSEMATVLNILARRMGEQAGVSAEA